MQLILALILRIILDVLKRGEMFPTKYCMYLQRQAPTLTYDTLVNKSLSSHEGNAQCNSTRGFLGDNAVKDLLLDPT